MAKPPGSRSACRASSATPTGASATRSAWSATARAFPRRPSGPRHAPRLLGDDLHRRRAARACSGSSRRRSSSRSPATPRRAPPGCSRRRGSCSTSSARRRARSPSAREDDVTWVPGDRSGARPGSSQLGSPDEVEAVRVPPTASSTSGRGSTRGPGMVRARCFVKEAGIEEDEATGRPRCRSAAELGREIEVRQGRGLDHPRASVGRGLRRGGRPGRRGLKCPRSDLNRRATR